MQRARALAVSLAALAWGAMMWPTSAGADCVGPELAIGEEVPYSYVQLPVERLSPGQQVKVTGEWFRNGCNDTGGACGLGGERETPMKNVQLVVKQGQLEWQVDRESARGKHFTVRWEFQVPADLAAGRAELLARTKDGEQGRPIPIVVEKASAQ